MTRTSPFGVLVVNRAEPGGGLGEGVPFLQSIANVLADALVSREARREIRRQGLHDPLTGLPNRDLFLDRVERASGARPPAGTPSRC